MNIPNHEHRFRPVDESPVIEDGAAIFHERCDYRPTIDRAYSKKHDEYFYEEGPQCEETRSYRFEQARIVGPGGEHWQLPDITEWQDNDLPEEVEERVVTVEQRHCYVGPGDEETKMDVDPDPESGVVRIEYNGWTLIYEA